ATRPTLASPTVRRRSSLCSGLTQGDIIFAQCYQGDSRLPFMRVYDAIRSKLCPLQVPVPLICKLSKRFQVNWYQVPVIARQPGNASGSWPRRHRLLPPAGTCRARSTGDKVALRWTTRGTDRGALRTPPGIAPPTDQQISVPGVNTFALPAARSARNGSCGTR